MPHFFERIPYASQSVNVMLPNFVLCFWCLFITHATCIAASHWFYQIKKIWPLGILFWINIVYSNIEQIGSARRTNIL